MLVKVLGKKVLVEISRIIKTESGIILPREEDRNDKTIEAKILAIGEEVEGLSIGDTIIMNKFCGKTINQDSESEYIRLVDFNDILAKIVK